MKLVTLADVDAHEDALSLEPMHRPPKLNVRTVMPSARAHPTRCIASSALAAPKPAKVPPNDSATLNSVYNAACR